MRQMISANKELSERLDKLEKRYDAQFKVVFNSIRELLDTKPKLVVEPVRRKKIGFGDD